MRKNVFIIIVLILLLILAKFSQGLNPYFYQVLIFWGINSILAMSLNLINGFTGQFSIGHAGFMAAGGYLSAALTVYHGDKIIKLLSFMPESISKNIVFFIFLIIGGLFSALLGVVIGIPTLRLKGDYLAIATLGFGEIIRVIIYNMDVVGGARGFPGIPQLTNSVWVMFWAFICFITLYRIINSSHGRAIISIREDETASEAMGVNTTYYKVLAFSIGAFFAGIAGGLFGHYLMLLHPASFTFMRSVEVLLMIVLGGLGSLTGSIIGAFVLTVLPEALRGFSGLRLVIYSLTLIILMLIRPMGLMGNREISFRSIMSIVKKLNRRTGNIK
ncbi:branched-chain amino acid ABC transporter permease [Dictyoglomus thermophilum]|uniref:Branched-chain amino acid ABC transporter permease n=1 Tax=Dictyoglomus thermophilum TaxID=14 RepID=A0A7C2CKT2_DICTH|nr:branched-chain amino acid ABC transporter permease [Dictyoglomus thermophilum]TYT22824.1 branched-chain amino acid ABC transporter permease [Dictyoglomus thermophilum]